MTKSRIAIIDTIVKIPGKYTIEEFYSAVHKKYPEIGIATIYRNKGLMEEIGLIVKAGFKDHKTEYMACNLFTGKDLERKIGKSKLRSNNKNEYILDENDLSNSKQNDYDLRDPGTIKIKTLESRIDKWISDLQKLKNKKGETLENIINDFSRIDRIIINHGYSRDNLIQILIEIQKKYNWLPKHVLFYLSKKLDVPLTSIYNIATFYNSFNLEPCGKHSIIVCTGTACHLRGAMNLLQKIVSILNVKPGDTTDDYKFTLSTVNCLGACALGPIMMIDNKYYSNPSTNKLKKLLKSLS